MTKKDKVLECLRKKQLASLKDIMKMCKVSEPYVQKLARSNIIVSPGKGYYTLMRYSNEYTELAMIQKAYPDAIFSGKTALILHGLCDETGASTFVTVPTYRGVIQRPDVKTTRQIKKNYEQGIMTKTFGCFPLKLYCIERCLCEAKKKLSQETFLRAIKRSTQEKLDIHISEIRKYDRLFHTDVAEHIIGERFEEQQDV